MTSEDLRSIHGVVEVTVPVGDEETLDYSQPHIWTVLPKKQGRCHDVIRYGRTIYCPTLGIAMDADEYKQRYVAFVLQEFRIPWGKRK